MKRLALFVASLMIAPLVVEAAGNHPMAGCGLGYIAFGHQQNSKVYQVLSATVNDIVSPKTSAITSGTSGCTEDGTVKLAHEVQLYAEINLEPLRRDIAAGEGEYVQTFASLLGAGDSTRDAMVQFLKQEYTTLFPSSDVDAQTMLNALSAKLSTRTDLILG